MDKKDIPEDTRHYRSFLDELGYQDSVVYRRERAVTPDALRADITSRIHSSDLGVGGRLR